MVSRLKSTLVILASVVLLSGCNPFDKNLKTGLQVMTNDIESNIFIDDQFLDKTPIIDKTLQPGKHTLKIIPSDSTYAPFETVITLREGLLTVVTWKPGKTSEEAGGVIYEMEPLADEQKTEISFLTIPDGAIIKLDDEDNRFSPVTVPDVSAGNHQFEVTLPSYGTQSHTISVVPGYKMIVKVILAREPEALIDEDKIVAPEIATLSAIPRGASASGQVQILPTETFEGTQEILRVRDQATTSGKEVATVAVGQRYQLLKTEPNWYYIAVNQTLFGWISKRYATVVTQ